MSAMQTVTIAKGNGHVELPLLEPTLGPAMIDIRRLLEETRVGLAPGVAFGAGGEGSIRICYAAEQSILEPAMERLTRFLRSGL